MSRRWVVILPLERTLDATEIDFRLPSERTLECDLKTEVDFRLLSERTL